MRDGSKSGFARAGIGVLLITLALVFSMTSGARAQVPDLIITVGDTVGSSGQQNSVITVFMDNFFDSVVAFGLWLRIGNSSIMEFQTDTATVTDTTFWLCAARDSGGNCTTYVASDADTTYWVCDSVVGPDCVDSTQVSKSDPWDFFVVADSIDITVQLVQVGSVDTAGTLVSGWELIESRSTLGNGQDLLITGVADRLTKPGSHPGIGPQQGGVLIRLLADIFVIDDTVTDRTSAIIPDPFRDYFSFSRPDGTRIGESDSLRVDTNYWQCDSWVPPDSQTCLNYTKVFGPPADSISIDTVTVTYIDTAKVKLIWGSLTVLQGVCGEIDNAPGGEIDIGDLTYLISYLFINGPAPDPISSADVDCAGNPPNPVDIGDLTYLISYLFLGGSAPCDCQGP